MGSDSVSELEARPCIGKHPVSSILNELIVNSKGWTRYQLQFLGQILEYLRGWFAHYARGSGRSEVKTFATDETWYTSRWLSNRHCRRHCPMPATRMTSIRAFVERGNTRLREERGWSAKWLNPQSVWIIYASLDSQAPIIATLSWIRSASTPNPNNHPEVPVPASSVAARHGFEWRPNWSARWPPMWATCINGAGKSGELQWFFRGPFNTR